MSIDWLKPFQGNTKEIIEEFKSENAENFKLNVKFLLENKVLQIRAVLPPLLAAAFAVNDKDFVRKLLYEADILDISKAVQLIRQGDAGIGLNKRIKLTLQNWMYSLPGQQLELEGLAYPNLCREIIDLIHTNPNRFPMNWWQKYIFEAGMPPKDSLTARYLQINSLSVDKRKDLIRNHPVSWTYLLSRAFRQELPLDIVELTIEKAPFMYLIHYLDKLAGKEDKLDEKLANKLIETAHNTAFNFGLVLKKYIHNSRNLNAAIKAALLDSAQTLLNNARTPELREPIFIIGDKSASMSTSIQAAVLMSGILAQKLKGCRLLFFNNTVTTYKAPKDVKDILKALNDVRSSGSTAISAAIGAAVRQNAKTIILISDGGHNTPSGNYKEDLKNMDINPTLPDIDFYYIMVRGDYDRVWQTYNAKTGGIRRLFDLKTLNVSFVYGFLKILLQLFNYDLESKVWDEIEAIKGAFLPGTFKELNKNKQKTDNSTSKADINLESIESKKIEGISDDLSEDICEICGEEVSKRNAILLTCGHRYHKKCLKRYWALLDGEKRCVYNCITPTNVCIVCGAELNGDTCEECGTQYHKL
ncbi:MAG: hypothetical protein GF364_17610 [Candidatus Lokiarchaeota archaeon]|nr:hypothetical protein [Candidatus Lokiarchaeota archaeon]